MAAGREINEGESTTAHTDIAAIGKSIPPKAGVVGSAVGLDERHRQHRPSVSPINQAAYTAHR